MQAKLQDMKVTAAGYDFGAAHAAMRRLVDGNILPACRPRCWSAGIWWM